ncbi:diguanylate cyclase [Clostridia bacterium]|nr:diguanylate cyclase [Clostridia bacterium]
MSDFFVGIFYNASLLITLSFFFANITLKKDEPYRIVKMIGAGLFIGIVGISLMLNPMFLLPGVFFDTRTILLTVTGFFFGLVPTLVASIITVIFRLTLGGVGAYIGSLTIILASVCGLIFRKIRYQKIMTKKCSILDFYLLGLIVHVLMVSSLLLLPVHGFNIAKKVAFPVILLYPLVLTLISQVIKKLQENARIKMELKDSEETCKLYLSASPYGIFVIDFNESITEINPKITELFKAERNDMLGRRITDLFDDKQGNLIHEHFLKTRFEDDETDLTIEYIEPDSSKRIFRLKTVLIKEQKILGYLDDITSEELLRKKIEFLNYHDSLTGVYNRRFFEEECKRLNVARKMPLGIVIGDVNGLKITNDGFGHLSGDELIKKASEAMQKSLRKEDIMARWGGDEFIILLPNTGYKDTLNIIDRIQNNMSEVVTETGILSISFGLAVKKSQDEDFEDIFRKAEDAMYRQKMHDSPSAKNITLRTIINSLYNACPREEEHSKGVANYAKRLSMALGHDARFQKDAEVAGRLHDIGKIAVGQDILDKTKELTKEDWHELRKHPEVGYRILQNVSTLGDVANVILSHHEWYDGSGYPQGLYGEKIPEMSRIISVCDAYEAMITDKPYRSALTKEVAKEELKKQMGTQFDPTITRVFLDEVLKDE